MRKSKLYFLALACCLMALGCDPPPQKPKTAQAGALTSALQLVGP